MAKLCVLFDATEFLRLSYVFQSVNIGKESVFLFRFLFSVDNQYKLII
jgi:hypothetical protein